jgi:predicted short-subunit dehydrogenase-like oxidoreductase (DUF2520 family)
MDNIAVIGAGKLACSLTYALIKAGYRVNCVLSRSKSSAKALADKFNIKDHSADYTDLNRKLNVFFLCVPDSAIVESAEALSLCNIDYSNSVFIHLSGAQNTSLLNTLKEKGGHTASFHIMQSFPSKRIVKIKNCYCAIETNDLKAEKFLYKLANRLELNPFKIESENKILYHLTGVFISNFLVGNFYNALTIFNESKIENIDFISLMEPILKATINNMKKNGITKALSGPIDRGDVKTIAEHLDSLNNSKLEYEKKFDLILSYISQSVSLIGAVKDKYGELSPGHVQAGKKLEDSMREACYKNAMEKCKN